MNNFNEVVAFVSVVMVAFMLGFFIRSIISPKKKLIYTDVGDKTIKELMESSATIKDLVRSIQKVEGVI